MKFTILFTIIVFTAVLLVTTTNNTYAIIEGDGTHHADVYDYPFNVTILEGGSITLHNTGEHSISFTSPDWDGTIPPNDAITREFPITNCGVVYCYFEGTYTITDINSLHLSTITIVKPDTPVELTINSFEIYEDGDNTRYTAVGDAPASTNLTFTMTKPDGTNGDYNGSAGTGQPNYNHDGLVSPNNDLVYGTWNFEICAPEHNMCVQESFTINEPVTLPDDGAFTLPCSMQENGDGVSSSSCNGFYSNGIARAEVGINSSSDILSIQNYQAVGFFIDENGNQGSNISINHNLINPGDSATLVFENTVSGYVSEFQMQMLGGEFIFEEPLLTSITVTTDKSSYDEGETIHISGTVNNPSGTTPVQIFILDPDQNIVSISQPTLNYGNYSFMYNSGGGLMENSGQYQIRTHYGSVTNNITFMYTAASPVVTPPTNPIPTNTIGAVEESGFSQSCVETGCYTPLTAVVNYGDTVTMTNTDPTGVHTFTSGTVNGFTPNPSQIFDSGVLMSGDSVEWTANVSGEVPYYCMLHTWMVGTIVVQGTAPADITINDSLTITGSIDNYDSNQFDYFNFLIISSTGMAISESGNFIPQLNGNFATEINLGGLGVSSGTYTLVSNFNGVQSTTTFNYYPGIGEIDKTIFIENEIIPEPEPVVNTSQDFLTITGSIINYDSIEYKSPIVIMIKASNGNIVSLEQVLPTAEGRFNHVVKLGGTMQTSGYYDIQAKFGSDESTTNFYYEPGVGTVSKNIVLQYTSEPEPVPIPEPVQPMPESEPVSIQTNIITTASGSAFSPECASTSQGCFIPKIAIVSVGSTVTFSNTDSNMHTFTSGNPSDEIIGTEFNSGMLAPGDSAQWMPENVGTFSYFDMIHPWMQGTIIVQGSGPVVEPTPQPEPEPVSLIDLDISISKTTYDLGDLVSFSINGNNFSGTQNVSVDVTDPRGNTVVSRSINISPNTSGEIEFRLSENFKTGTYKITATTYDNGKTISEKSYFKLQSQFNSFTISDVMVSDQQGNASTLQSGEMGFIKVNLFSTKSIATLVTVNLFDSELTSIGIGSVQTTLASGESEIILSFMIPDDAAIGPADIYVNAFSDWPSSGGTALTGELASMEDIS